MFKRGGKSPGLKKIVEHGKPHKGSTVDTIAHEFIESLSGKGIQAILMLRAIEDEEDSVASVLNYSGPKEVIDDVMSFIETTIEASGGKAEIDFEVVFLDKDGVEIDPENFRPPGNENPEQN